METGMKEILVLMPLSDEDCLRLRRAAPSARFTFTKGERAAEETLERADAILGNLPPELLPQAKRLKWLQLNSAGADPYLVPGVLPAGVTLTSATGAYGPAVAEHMLAVTLSLLKKLPLYRDNQNQRLWRDEGPVKGIAGSLFLIVGFGDIGRTYGRMAHVLGGRVIGMRRRAGEAPDFAERVVPLEELDAWLPRADVTALFLPGGAQTAGLFSADRLARMKRGSLLLNGGRGGAVDTQALAAALESGRLGGAGLDVTDPEPLPPDHPLWKQKNAVITPHVAGWYHMEETVRRLVDICCANLRRYEAGEPLGNVVDFATGCAMRDWENGRTGCWYSERPAPPLEGESIS